MLKAIVLLPGNAAVFIPALLVYLEGGINPGWGLSPKSIIVFPGIVLIGCGLLMAYHTVRLFFKYGEGTPAPWEPPPRLVIRGAYRHVRNPMITSVLAILLGESLALGSIYILIWFGVFFVMNNFYFIFIEEPGLVRRFGGEYIDYKRHVPRWVPRRRPYGGPGDGL